MSYIGVTKNITQRLKRHRNKLSDCTKLKEAINDFGWSSFKFDVIKEFYCINEALEFEEASIIKLNTLFPNGYNLHKGGLDNKKSDYVLICRKDVFKTDVVKENKRVSRLKWIKENPEKYLDSQNKATEMKRTGKYREENSNRRKLYFVNNPEKIKIAKENLDKNSELRKQKRKEYCNSKIGKIRQSLVMQTNSAKKQGRLFSSIKLLPYKKRMSK